MWFTSHIFISLFYTHQGNSFYSSMIELLDVTMAFIWEASQKWSFEILQSSTCMAYNVTYQVRCITGKTKNSGRIGRRSFFLEMNTAFHWVGFSAEGTPWCIFRTLLHSPLPIWSLNRLPVSSARISAGFFLAAFGTFLSHVACALLVPQLFSVVRLTLALLLIFMKQCHISSTK